MVGVAFWTLGILCLLNLNDLTRMWIGAERAFSIPILIACFVALAGLLRHGPREALGVPGVLILATLLSYASIGMAASIANDTGLQTRASWYFTRHAKSILVIVAAAVGGRVLWRQIGGDRVLRGVLIILTASCTLMAASPWLGDLFRNPTPEGAYRYGGAFSDPNHAAIVACLTVAAALALARRGHSRVFPYAALVVATLALVGTLSRTALVVLPFALLGVWLANRRAPRKRIAGGIAIIGLVLAAVWTNRNTTWITDRQRGRWYSLFDLVEGGRVEELPLEGRASLWRLAWEAGLESPLLGNGLGSAHHLERGWINSEGILMGAHNQYLILFGEAGVLPALFFVSFLVVTVAAGFRKRAASAALVAVSGWTLVLALFSLTLHGLLTLHACTFIIGLSCAFTASALGEQGAQPEAPQPS